MAKACNHHLRRGGAGTVVILTILLAASCERKSDESNAPSAEHPAAHRKGRIEPKVATADHQLHPAGVKSDLRRLLSKNAVAADDIERIYNKLHLLDASDFDEIFGMIGDLEISVHLKVRLKSRALTGLSAAGFYDKAWALAAAEPNPNNRAALLTGTFAGSTAPIKRLTLDFSKLGNFEKERVAGGLASNIASRPELDPSDFLSLGPLDETTRLALVSGIESYVGADTAQLEVAKEICRIIETEGGSGDEMYERILAYLAREHQELVLSELESLNSAWSEDGMRLVKEISKIAPDKTAAIFARKNDPARFAAAISTWAQIDISQTEIWLEKQSSSLSSELKDSASGVIALARLQQDASFPTAYEALLDIQDEEHRRDLEGKIWAKEREVVIRQARTDPASFVQKIVSGESQHAPYWIETAMTQWMVKDGDAAWTWYENNRSSLTPEQNEAVALTYARQALKTGHPETATEWAKHVVTPKFQAKIRAEIDAAAKSGQ